MRNDTDRSERVRKILLDKHSFYGSWAAVAEDIGMNRGVLCAVANGKRKASNSLLHALGLPPRTVAVEPCAHCGQAHTLKHCPRAPRKYAPHPVMRVTAIRRLLQSPYRDS